MLTSELERIESLKDRERIYEDYGIERVMSSLFQKSDPSQSSSSEGSYMSEDEQFFYDNLHGVDAELTSGYTTISSNISEFVPIKSKQANQLKEETKKDEGQQAKSHENPKGSTKKTLSAATAAKEASSNTIGKSSKSKTQSFLDPNSLAYQQFSDPQLLDHILNSERFKNLKNNKNQFVTLPEYSSEWMEKYRLQEDQRYNNPTKPWIYLLEDGSTSVVGPVIKKRTQNIIQKPRDHPQLHSGRPAVVTLLCLARDAASRLPDGIGTRGDIIELMKHS